jgi:hypothetical protein
MDKAEAHSSSANRLESLRRTSYDELVERLLDDSETVEVAGPSGTTYQVESQAFWDGGSRGDHRVAVAIDDGGRQACRSRTASSSRRTARSWASSSGVVAEEPALEGL